MTVTITLDPDFRKLNDDPSLRIKPGGVGREREAVVNIVIAGETAGAGGLIAVPFDGTGLGFKQVYKCTIDHNDFGEGHASYEPATGNDAATGELHLVDFTGADAAGSVTTTLRATIRGV